MVILTIAVCLLSYLVLINRQSCPRTPNCYVIAEFLLTENIQITDGQETLVCCKMPADICGVSPPFAYSHSLLALHNTAEAYYRNSFRVFDPPFARVPTLRLQNLKSCLKSIPSVDQSTSLKNAGGGQVPTAKQELQYPTINSRQLLSRSSKKGKRVTFADSQGKALALIKYLTESSNEPPKSSSSGDLVKDLMKNLTLTSSPEQKRRSNEQKPKLTLKFEQPVSNYVWFKQRLVSNNVSLENVVLKENNSIHGTVKVKNTDYEKVVLVRVTFDNWESFNDVTCKFVKNAYETGVFDTFQFKIDIPEEFFELLENHVHFCVCYRSSTQEFWDNNEGKNYVIASNNPLARNTTRSRPISIPSRRSSNRSYPSTYCELPSPEHMSWLGMENAGPFY